MYPYPFPYMFHSTFPWPFHAPRNIPRCSCFAKVSMLCNFGTPKSPIMFNIVLPMTWIARASLFFNSRKSLHLTSIVFYGFLFHLGILERDNCLFVCGLLQGGCSLPQRLLRVLFHLCPFFFHKIQMRFLRKN